MNHAARWILLILCLLAPASWCRGEAKADELTEEEVRKEFKKLASRIQDLERDDKSSSRHVTDLETALRDLRFKLDRLETRLKVIDDSIETLRAELKQAVETAKGGPAKGGPTAGQPQPATPTEQARLAKIVGDRHTIDGDFLTFTGLVVNLSKEPIMVAVVELTLLDNARVPIKTESAFTTPKVIPPEGRATYRIVTRRDARIAGHHLNLKLD